MKPIILALLVASGGVLSGCAGSGQRLSPEQITGLVRAFHEAGCGGRVDVEAGAGTGQLGGQAHANIGLHGECPQRPLVPPT